MASTMTLLRAIGGAGRDFRLRHPRIASRDGSNLLPQGGMGSAQWWRQALGPLAVGGAEAFGGLGDYFELAEGDFRGVHGALGEGAEAAVGVEVDVLGLEVV